MRAIKLAIISFAFIFLLVTAMSLMIPSRIRISRAVDLSARPQEVFSLVKNQDQWPRWHPLFADSAAQHDWQSAKKTVVASTDSTYILQLQKQGRKSFINGFQLHSYPHTQTVTLQWYMDFRLSWYPWEKFSSLFFEKTYGVIMEQGLANLKKELEL